MSATHWNVQDTIQENKKIRAAQTVLPIKKESQAGTHPGETEGYNVK